jgi:hypothetical protein
VPDPPAKKKKEPRNDSPFTAVIRWFTEAKQYLAAFAASIVAFGVLQHQIDKINWTNWVADAVAIIPPLLVFICKTIPRLIFEHRNQILVQTSKQENVKPRKALPEADYFYIGPYPESRWQRYDRADGVHIEILNWLKETKESVVILSGLSGTGKTSLLEAFVAPKLRESKPPFRVFLIRGFDDPLAELRRQLLSPGVIWKEPNPDLGVSLDEIVRRALSRLRQADPAIKLLVVLDQFEELITINETGNSSAVTGVTDFLKKLRESPVDGLVLLLSVRTDYQSFLEVLKVPPQHKNQNWREVPPFTYSAALSFLTAPETGLKIQPERLRRVLREATAADGTRGLVRPIILNMLGVVLQRIADSPEAERPTRTLLTDDLRAFINDPNRRAIARSILPHMLTEADTKWPRRIGELCDATKLDAHVIHGCLLGLETSGYVRQIGRSEEILNRIWEVSHDFVARLLGAIVKHPFRTWWERFRRVFYPIAIGTWTLTAIFLIFAEPWLVRKASEFQLEHDYGFSVRETDTGYILTEEVATFNELPAAIPYLRKLNPTTLKFPGCSKLVTVRGLEDLKNLQNLVLSGCRRLSHVNELKDLENLQILDLSYCVSLTNVDGLKDLKGLKVLNLSNCTSLTNVDGLKGHNDLQSLILSSSSIGADSLKELHEQLTLTNILDP